MEWQPIETAPKDGTSVILYCKNHSPYVFQANFNSLGCKEAHGFWETPVGTGGGGILFRYEWASHWMPLPPPPAS